MSESLNLGDGIHEHLIINGRMPAAFNNQSYCHMQPSLFKKYRYSFEAFMHEWHILVSITLILSSVSEEIYRKNFAILRNEVDNIFSDIRELARSC